MVNMLQSSLPMPQMFPMPTLLLVILVSIISLMSMVRIYWQRAESPSSLKLNSIDVTGNPMFLQTW